MSGRSTCELDQRRLSPRDEGDSRNRKARCPELLPQSVPSLRGFVERKINHDCNIVERKSIDHRSESRSHMGTNSPLATVDEKNNLGEPCACVLSVALAGQIFLR